MQPNHNHHGRKSNWRPTRPILDKVGSLRQEFIALGIVLSDPFRFIDGDAAHRAARAVSQGRLPATGENN